MIVAAATAWAFGAGVGSAAPRFRPFDAFAAQPEANRAGGPVRVVARPAFAALPATEAATAANVTPGTAPDGPGRFATTGPTTTAPSAPSSLAAHPFAGFGRTVVADTLGVVEAPLSWDRHAWLNALAGVAAIAALTTVDESIAHSVQAHRTATTDHVAKLVEPFGADRAFETIGAFYLAGLVFHDDRARDVAADSVISSIIAGGLISPVVKKLVGRARPSQAGGEEDVVRFFGSDQSFPSGHTTEAFAVASVVAAHYRSAWVQVASYGLAGLVGLARIDHNAHFASDVLAGALLGTVVGREVVHLDDERRRTTLAAHEVEVGPLVTAHGAGIDVAMTF